LEEIKNTPFAKFDYIFTQKTNLPLRADAFRLLMPYKYISENKYDGILYFDLDIMFLRDFNDILNHSFCYQWEKQPYANSAILFINNKTIIENVINIIEKKRTVIPWIIFNYSNKELYNLMVLPCAYFDPIWAITNNKNYEYPIINFDDFFKKYDGEKTSYKDFFKGAYAYHWHNKWDYKADENSLFYTFYKEFSNLLINK